MLASHKAFQERHQLNVFAAAATTGVDASGQSTKSAPVNVQPTEVDSHDLIIELSSFYEAFSGSAKVTDDSSQARATNLHDERDSFELCEVVVATSMIDEAAGVGRGTSCPQPRIKSVPSSSTNICFQTASSSAVNGFAPETKFGALSSARRGKGRLSIFKEPVRKPTETFKSTELDSKLVTPNSSVSLRSSPPPPTGELPLPRTESDAVESRMTIAPLPSSSKFHHKTRGRTAKDIKDTDGIAPPDPGFEASNDARSGLDVQSIQASSSLRRSSVRALDVPNAVRRSCSHSRVSVEAAGTRVDDPRIPSAVPITPGPTSSMSSRLSPVGSHDLIPVPPAPPRSRSQSRSRFNTADSQVTAQPHVAPADIPPATSPSVAHPVLHAFRGTNLGAGVVDRASSNSNSSLRSQQSSKMHELQSKAALAASADLSKTAASNQYEEC
jgi:hypothetical protein